MQLAKIYQDDNQLIKASRDGITKETFIEIVNSTGMPIVGFAAITHLTPRTLQRKKPDEKISPEASERAILIGRLYYKGYQVFGSKEKFHDWANREHLSLNDKKPTELLDTITGISLVQDEILRIEYGFVA